MLPKRPPRSGRRTSHLGAPRPHAAETSFRIDADSRQGCQPFSGTVGFAPLSLTWSGLQLVVCAASETIGVTVAREACMMIPYRVVVRPASGLLVLLIALGGCSAKEPTEPAIAEATHLTEISIPIDGMSCSSCAARVKKTLTSMDGVASAEVDLGARAARIRYIPQKVSPERLVAAVNELGYRAGTPTGAE